MLLSVFNPAIERERLVRVKVPHGKIEVIGEDNHEIVADVICANDKDATDCDLFFSAKLKASSFSYFKINPSINSPGSPVAKKFSLRLMSSAFERVLTTIQTFSFNPTPAPRSRDNNCVSMANFCRDTSTISESARL